MKEVVIFRVTIVQHYCYSVSALQALPYIVMGSVATPTCSNCPTVNKTYPNQIDHKIIKSAENGSDVHERTVPIIKPGFHIALKTNADIGQNRT